MIRLLLGLVCLLATAQTPPLFRSNLELVTIPCTVLDSEGKLVRDLKREEFRVYDNGARRIIQNLWVDTDSPLTLGVLIDASDSQHDQIDEHRRAALTLLERLLRPGDRAFVISVNEEVRVWADLAESMTELRAQMSLAAGPVLGEPCGRRPHTLPGGTPASLCGGSPLWNAIYDTARLKLRPLQGNKALVILTDGFDTGSTHTWRQAADEVAEAEASVYAIQYQSGLGGRFAPDLYQLLEESGGAWFGPPSDEAGAIVSRLESDLRQRYVLSFRPDTGGKLRHEISVEVTRPDLKVRARKAYLREAR